MQTIIDTYPKPAQFGDIPVSRLFVLANAVYIRANATQAMRIDGDGEPFFVDMLTEVLPVSKIIVTAVR